MPSVSPPNRLPTYQVIGIRARRWALSIGVVMREKGPLQRENGELMAVQRLGRSQGVDGTVAASHQPETELFE